MNPKHGQVTRPRYNRQREEVWARAPYNFVPLPEQTVTVDDLPTQDRYTGYTGRIECTLVTESPLYVRCSWEGQDYRLHGRKRFDELPRDVQQKRARFYFDRTAASPVIPGSSLRGMVRALVEIIGYGKMDWVTPMPLVYRAVGDTSSLGIGYRELFLGPNRAADPDTTIELDYPALNVRAGYLKREGHDWLILPAKEHLGETFVHVDYALAEPVIGGHGRQMVHDVWVAPSTRAPSPRGPRGPRGREKELVLRIALTQQVQPRAAGGQAPPSPGMVPAVLIESGQMGQWPPRPGEHSKHWHCAIYEPNKQAEAIRIPAELWQLYREDLDLPRGTRTQTRRLEHDGDPLFFLLDAQGDLVFFGPTMLFRLPYPNVPQDLVPGQLRNQPHIDLAEAIFGFVPESEQDSREARAGRVFFSDARLDRKERDEETAQERPSVWWSDDPNWSRILSSPKPTSFQHYLTQQLPDRRDELDHYGNLSPHDTVIRGHKLYWHRREVTHSNVYENNEDRVRDSRKQYTKIKPVNTGISFSFSIRFECLRAEELGALLWALKLPGEPGAEYRHRLGMGKPLGLGTVFIGARCRLSERQDAKKGRYAALFVGNEPRWHLPENEQPDEQWFLVKFERFVLDRMHRLERGTAQTLKDVERIRVLLTMLQKGGPGDDRTSYMDVEDFRPRPVLPDPLTVARGPVSAVRPARRPGPGPASARPARPTPASIPRQKAAPGPDQTGQVKRFDDIKGYGFIAVDGGGDVFVHYSAIVQPKGGPLQPGQRVQFDVVDAPKGPKAQNVRLLR